MGGMVTLIECVLIGLLGATLLQGVRLSRTLGGVRRDRSEIEGLIQHFNDSTRQADLGAERLRVAADAAGRTMVRQIEVASQLRDELTELTERGERLAHRLGVVVRAEMEPAVPLRRSGADLPRPEPGVPQRSQAERDLLRALRVTR